MKRQGIDFENKVLDFMIHKEQRTDSYIMVEDEIYSSMCEDCGDVYTYDYGEELVEECEMCGCEDMIHNTRFEGLECSCCGHTFEPHETVFENEDYTICSKCHEKMVYFESITDSKYDLEILLEMSCNISDIVIIGDYYKYDE